MAADGCNVTYSIDGAAFASRDLSLPALPLTPPPRDNPVAHRTFPSGLKPRTLRRVVEHIDSHLGDRFTLEGLAQLACVSRFHFARLFRCSMGKSPMAFLVEARVRRARELLESDVCTIADAAAHLGFFDQSHFTRTFRRLTGQTPGEYARRHRHRAEPARGRETVSGSG